MCVMFLSKMKDFPIAVLVDQGGTASPRIIVHRDSVQYESALVYKYCGAGKSPPRFSNQ